MEINFNDKIESIQMLTHWSYRALNLEGRVTIVNVLAIPKVTHLAIVISELNDHKATQTEKPRLKFICEKFEDQEKIGQKRVN